MAEWNRIIRLIWQYASGRVEADGSFRLTCYRAFDGAAPGQHQVRITWYSWAGGGDRGANRLPERPSGNVEADGDGGSQWPQ